MTPEEAISLRDWMTEKFLVLEKQLAKLNQELIGKDRFEVWCNRVSVQERQCEELDKRVIKLERSVWLMQILMGAIAPIITAVFITLLVAWLTGSMKITFK